MPLASKARTGIHGLDRLTEGGLPKGRVTLLEGPAGCGKTMLSLQFLSDGAARDQEPGLFVSFEEDAEDILADADPMPWGLRDLRRRGLFDIIDAKLSADTVRSGSFDLAGLLGIVAARAEGIGATRVVLDAVEVLTNLLDDTLAERMEFYRIKSWARRHGFTCIISARDVPDAETRDRAIERFLPYMADCWICLRHNVLDSVSVRSLQVRKQRGSGHHGGVHPFAIRDSGVSVPGTATPDLQHPVSEDLVSSGIARLDRVLGGGYRRGSSVLIAGEPGTAKTTLAAAFADAACCRGERALFVSFDEAPAQIVRNLRSVGLDLQPHIDGGRLFVRSIRRGAAGVEDQFIDLAATLDEIAPDCMVIDPLSAIEESVGRIHPVEPSKRVIDHAKQRGVTLVTTSLLDGSGIAEQTGSHVSTVADTWIQLSYVVAGGERNRALTIVKSRGMAHSNQVRELVLDTSGLDLADVYTAGGDVLMGTARLERERDNAFAEDRRQREATWRLRELEESEAGLVAEVNRLAKQLESRRAEIDELRAGESDRRSGARQTERAIFDARRGDREAADRGEDLP